MHVDIFVIFGEMWGDLIDQYLSSQGIVGRCAVNLLSLVLNPAKFLT
jgi:hypothetical protein